MSNFSIDDIQSYLTNKMPPKAKRAFEQELAVDNSLVQKVNEQKLEMQVLEFMLEKDLKADMRKWKTEAIHEETRSYKDKNKKTLKFSLIGLLLLSIGLIYFFFNYSTDKKEIKQVEEKPEIEKSKKIIKKQEPKKLEEIPVQKIKKSKPNQIAAVDKKKDSPKNSKLLAVANELFQPITLSQSNLRSHEETDQISEAIKLYNQQKFNEAIKLFNKAQIKDKDNLEIQYFLAAAYYSKKDFKNANSYLKNLNKKEDFLFIENVNWMLLMSYIFEGDEIKGQQILSDIKNDRDHSFNKMAMKFSL